MSDKPSIIRKVVRHARWRSRRAKQSIREFWIGRQDYPARFRIAWASATRKKIALFESDMFGIYSFLHPLVKRCVLSGRILPIIITHKAEMPAFEKELSCDGALRKTKYLLMSFDDPVRLQINPHIIISCQPCSLIARQYNGIAKIQTLHGCADKCGKLFGPRNLSDFTHLFSPGPIITELARSRLADDTVECHSTLQVLPIGYPKVDDLFDGTYSRERILTKLGLNPALPTVLYAPTWEREASWEQQGMEITEALLTLEANVLLKLHPITLADVNDSHLIKQGHGGKDCRPVVRDLERKRPRLRFIEYYHANPLMAAADLLVSDNSGISVEFVLQNKPVVFVDTPLVAKLYGDEPLHRRNRSFGEIVYDVRNLSSVVLYHLQHPEAKRSDRLAMIDRLVYNRGKAADAAMKAINEILFPPTHA